MRIVELQPVFVERVPADLEAGKLYVCKDCDVVVHLCPCGCNEKAVTPIGDDGWKLIILNGKVTLNPSVGNFQYKCKSHYFIRENSIMWCS